MILKRFKKIIVSFLCLVMLLSSMQISAVAQEDVSLLPQLQMSPLTITNADTKEVNGAFEVKNSSAFYATDLVYYIQILKGRELSQWEIVDKSKPINYEIGPNELKTIKFTYPMPQNISTDEYHIMVSIVSRTGLMLTFRYESLGEYKGSKDYLNFIDGDSQIVKDGEEISPLTGPNYKPGESPQAYIIFTSGSMNKIKAYPQMTVYARDYHFQDKPVEVVKADLVEFNPNETKKVMLNLPAQTKAESYLVSVKMINENGQQVSGVREFRYVVQGISAKILSVKAQYDKDASKVKASVQVIGPADATTLRNAVVEVIAYDNKTNKVIGQVSKTANLGQEKAVMDLELSLYNMSAKDIKIESKIIYEEALLDSNVVVIPGEYLTEKAAETFEPFNDVKGTTFEYATSMLREHGIINGYEDGTFRPETNISRAEFTKMVVGILGMQPIEKDYHEPKFNDVRMEHWALGYINLAGENGLIQGFDDGTFKPDDMITYAEVITLLVRAIGESDGVENIGTWPQNYIQKADSIKITSQVVNLEYSEHANRGNVAKLTWESFKKVLQK